MRYLVRWYKKSCFAKFYSWVFGGKNWNKTWIYNLRKQPTFCDVTAAWFASEITSEMKFYTDDRSLYPRLHSASDWSCHEGNFLQPIISTILQIWLVTHHQSRFTNLFRGKTNVCATKCRLFSYVKIRWIAQEVMIGPFSEFSSIFLLVEWCRGIW